MNRMIIAIDGPAASGKGTIARELAGYFKLPHLDTGLLYRATAQAMLDHGYDLNDVNHAVACARGLALVDFDPQRLRTRAIGEAASRVAVYSEVREALKNMQQHFAKQEGGAVLDGRDIGTVICPQAPVKIFVTATAEVRAARRLKELEVSYDNVTFEDILADIQHRDARDSHRVAAPLCTAVDAVVLDTTNLTIEESIAAAVEIVRRRITKTM